MNGLSLDAIVPTYYLPILEMLIINLISADQCLHKKYSRAKTLLIFLGFTLLLYGAILIFAGTSFKGDGRFLLGGFIFFFPYRAVYREKNSQILIAMCACWIYTLGIFAFSQQLGNLFFPENQFFILAAESLFFLATIRLFFKFAVPAYDFMIRNLTAFDRKWYRYLAVSGVLGLLSLITVNMTLIPGDASLLKLVTLALLLVLIGTFYFILYRFIRDAVRISHLEHAALRDPLTGLGNRTQLWNCLNSLIEQNQTFSVLFMDLDRFKQINDQYGHVAGDQYLKHFAGILERIFKGRGASFRFGGDEFVALYYGLAPKSIIDRVKECREWDDNSPCPFNQVSVGVLNCSPPHMDVDQILQQVDHIMYQNKLNKSQSRDTQTKKR